MTAAVADARKRLAARLYETYFAFDWGRFGGGPVRWVMDRPSYDRVRAAFVSEDQEIARAQAHAAAWIPVQDAGTLRCPACPSGPFASTRELHEHMAAMADPANREPAGMDVLLGTPVTVRDDGGEPHLELVK